MTIKTGFSVSHLTKKYPGVVALKDVSLTFEPGKVHALVGENGAGKSTLIKCLSGAITPTSGTLLIEGQSYAAMTPLLAKELGISVIYQEFNQVPSMSAADNVFLGVRSGKSFLLNSKERQKQAALLFRQLNVEIDPTQKVKDLSPACQQIIEIAKAIRQSVKLLIMDEPTAPLTIKEVKILFEIVKKLKAEGVAIAYISHRMEEIFEIADVVSVLRDGQKIVTKPIEETSRAELIKYIAGREVSSVYPRHSKNVGENSLEVNDLCGNGLEDVSFIARKSEIMGFAGLVGAGRTELMNMLCGVVPKTSGTIIKDNKSLNLKTPRDGIENGIGFIPEDRKLLGLFLNQSIRWNCSINAIKSVCHGIVVDEKAERAIAETYEKELQIKTPSLGQHVKNLSGGNQQKVVLAKTLACHSDVLIFDEPTRGIDVGGKQDIYKLINQLADDGKTILMVSSDLPELMGMCDRIAVICEGRLVATLNREEFDQTVILDYASGGGKQDKVDKP